MTDGCGFVGLDLGRCLTGTLLGWVPDWAWWGFEHWQWFAYGFIALVVLGALARVYMIFGTPGVVAVFGAATFILGFVLGKKSTVRVTPTVAGKPTVTFPGSRTPVVVKRPDKVHHDTIWDTLGKMPGR